MRSSRNEKMLISNFYLTRKRETQVAIMRPVVKIIVIHSTEVSIDLSDHAVHHRAATDTILHSASMPTSLQMHCLCPCLISPFIFIYFVNNDIRHAVSKLTTDWNYKATLIIQRNWKYLDYIPYKSCIGVLLYV